MFDISQIKLYRSSRSSISISILHDGTVSVKAPYLVPKKMIEEFVKSKSAWIAKRQSIVKANKKQPRKFQNGEKFTFLGKDYELELGTSFTQVEIRKDKLLFPLALSKRGEQAIQKWYIGQAKTLIKGLVDEYASKMNTEYKGLTFSDTRSQWGRCTHDNRLQFSWRLIMSPLLVVRYVVIHELAHTKEKNHSAKFWAIVRSFNPSYKLQIKWLRENGQGLRI